MRKCIWSFCLFFVTLTAADPFIGTWRLNLEKSDLRNGNVKSGTAIFRPLNNGYYYSTEIVFADTRIARLNGPVQFDGTVNQALLDGRAVTFVSQRLNDNAYQTIISDGRTGTTVNVLRYSVVGDTLTFQWLNGEAQPALILVYERD